MSSTDGEEEEEEDGDDIEDDSWYSKCISYK